MNERKRNTGINAGSSSILVIFVLLCLTTFATLSLVSANADYKLSKKTADSATEYYNADGEAEENLAILASSLRQAAEGSKNRQEYEGKVSSLADGRDNFLMITKKGTAMEISYVVPVNDRKDLVVSLVSDYDAAKAGTLYQLTQWKTMASQEWQSESGFQLWDGTFPELEEEPQIGE